MSLSDIVNVVVSKQSPGIQIAGFGIPLIASASATWTERTRTYTSLSGVSADFGTTTPEYLAAETVFAQSPRPPKIMIGRLANVPTEVQVITIKSVKDTTKYYVNAFYAGALHTATFTSGAGTTNDLIATGVRDALNALTSVNFTAALTGAGGSKVVTCTANTAGNWFSLEPLDTDPGTVGNLMVVAETEADPGSGIAADLTAIALESAAWYGLILLFKSTLIVQAAAGWVEANTKLFIMSSADTVCATDAESGATDVLHALKASARARTGGSYHPRGYEFFDCAEIGRWFPISPGGDNWRMKTLSGPSPAKLTETQKTNLEAKHAGYYYLLGSAGSGVNVVGGDGTVADNEYIDVIRGIDWWTARVQQRIVNLELSMEKIPFTDDGVNLIVGEVKSQNTEGIGAGLISPNPKPTVTAPLVANVSTTDKQNRHLPGVNTKWTLAGAINTMEVDATILA